jgi:hypothetical protein
MYLLYKKKKMQKWHAATKPLKNIYKQLVMDKGAIQATIKQQYFLKKLFFYLSF